MTGAASGWGWGEFPGQVHRGLDLGPGSGAGAGAGAGVRVRMGGASDTTRLLVIGYLLLGASEPTGLLVASGATRLLVNSYWLLGGEGDLTSES